MRGYTGPAIPLLGRGKPSKRRKTNAITLRPFVSMVDWMTLIMHGPFHAIALSPGEAIPWKVDNVRQGLVLRRVDLGAKMDAIWRKVFYVTEPGGSKLATILAGPVDHKRHPEDYFTVQFANDTLASGEWRELLVHGLMSMGCTYQGVQRLDIAVDGWEGDTIGDGGDFIGVVQAAHLGFGDYYGKAHWTTRHIAKSFAGFDFGSKAGNKFLRCYRKKMEMKAKGHKPHIVQAWKDALGGYDPMKDPREVARLEVQLKGREIRRYYDGERTVEGLTQLHDPHTRVKVFASAVETLYDFRGFPRDGRARTATPLHEWDWSLCTTNPVELLPREQRRKVISPHSVKVGIGAVYLYYLESCDVNALLMCEHMARSAGPEFLDWMRRKEKYWQASHRALREANLDIPGLQTPDAFTRSYLDRLADSVQRDVDPLETFNEGNPGETWTTGEADDDDPESWPF